VDSELPAILEHVYELLLLYLRMTEYSVILTKSIPINTITIQYITVHCVFTLQSSIENTHDFIKVKPVIE
jgi:hypothetical protein